MPELDANNWTEGQAAHSGYPVPPESSPAPGAEPQGAPPAPPGAPPEPAQQPGPEHPRFNEVYRNWKDVERENAELRERLTQHESLERPMGVAPPPPTQQPTPTSQQDDPEAWLENTITGALDKRLAPLEQALNAQQQTQLLAQQAARFRASNPGYNDAADSQRLLDTYRKYGGNVSLDDCFRFSFPERFAQGQPAPQGVPAPVADVPGAAPTVPGDSPAELMAKLANPSLTAYEREQIGGQLRNLGAWGMGAAEKALGFE